MCELILVGTSSHLSFARDSHVVLLVKNLPVNTEDIKDMGSIPESGGSPGGEHGNPLQYSCLENPMDRGAWQATVNRLQHNWSNLACRQHACPLLRKAYNYIFSHLIHVSWSKREEGPYGRSIFNCFEEPPYYLQRIYHFALPPTVYTHPCQHLSFVFLIITILTNMK